MMVHKIQLLFPGIFILVFLLALAGFFNGSASANDKKNELSFNDSNKHDLQFTPKEKQWLKDHPIIRARVGAVPPLHFFEKTYKGISVDYLNLISSRAGFQVQYISGIPWPKALEHIKNHEKIDLLLTAKKTEERQKFIAFTDYYLFMPWVIFTRTDGEFIGGMQDLISKTVSVEDGYVMHNKLRDEFPDINLLVVKTSKDAIESVASGKADAHIGNLTIATYIIQNNSLNNIKVAAPTPFGNHDQAMAIRSDWPELASIINKTLKGLSPGEHANIRHRWLALRYEYGISKLDILKWVLAISVFSLIIILVILFWNRALKKEVLKRQKTETELKKSEEKYRSIFENAVEGFFQSTPKGQFISVNLAFAKIFGYASPEELISSIPDISKQYYVNKEDRHKYANLLKKSGSVKRFEFKAICKDGSHIWVSNSTRALYGPEGKIERYEGNVTDITERRQAEMRLKENERRFRELFDNMGTGAAIYNSPDNGQSFIFMDLNKSGLDNAGKKKNEVIGYEVREVFPGVEALGLFDVFKRVWETGKPEHHPTSLYEDDKLELWVENYVCKLPSGELVAIYDDTTGQKKAEIEKKILEKQIRQSQKMESIGRLAGGVAHDYNNALSVILGFTELAMTDMESSDPLYADLNEVVKAAKRAADITRQLLAFARKQTISPKVLNLNDNVESMLKMLRRLIGEDIDLAWLPETNLWSVKMDPTQIDQILANLCVNSRDAINGVGKVTIETKNIVFDTAYCADHVGFVPGEFILMVVSDNGSGMDKETLDNIFEPFFTTKDVDKGTGLGLSTVYGIVKQNNGFINVYSEPGEGTNINVYLPRNEGNVLESKKEDKEKIPQGGEETILLVEDDLPVLKLAEKILNRLGYTVLTACTPDEAINVAREHSGKVHLLITDVIMPGMNGRELSEQLGSIWPDLKCMFMSGYTANAIAHHGVLDKGVYFIQKPFSRKALATIARKALDEN